MGYVRKPTKSTMSKRKPYKKATTASFAKKVRAVVAKVAETKSHIVVQNETTVSSLTSPQFATNNFTLNSIPQGDGINERVGNKITATFLNVRGLMHLASDAATQWFRIYVIEHDLNDQFPSDGLESDLGTFTPPTMDISAIYGRVNTTRYRVLATKLVKMGHTNGFHGSQMFNFNIKLKGNMYFEQLGGVPSKRKISLVVYNRRADNDEVLGTTCEFTFNSKFYFQEM